MNTIHHTMKRLAFLLFALLLSVQAWGQVASLRLIPNSFQVTNLTTGMSGSDTVYMSYGDSLLIEARAVLDNPASIVDEIGLGIAQDSMMAMVSDSLFPGAPIDTVLANDTVLIQIFDHVDSTQNRYSGGTGGGALVVVVWPVLRVGQGSTETSASMIFNFADRTAIDDPAFSSPLRVKCYPNPTQDRLYFQHNEPFSKFEYVRISTLDGQTLLHANRLPAWVDMSSWANGLYLLEVRYRDGIREVSKLQKR